MGVLVSSARVSDATVRITVLGELDALTTPRLRAEVTRRSRPRSVRPNWTSPE
ncbi:hypothetical protein AB0J66_40990 [Actinoplanes sp. NPDC049598]|uniref:hypothetical protein n=1 Tax=Actinoplanes sp. NPDC049598 TaxID=3154626 RepID=UPI00343AE3B1